jgi:L-amino acid N-acyltransferase YncA
MEVVIRKAARSDLQAINDIYNYYVLNSTCTYQAKPDTMMERNAWFDEHGGDYPVIVAEENSTVVGWASLSKFKKREAYRPTVEISIYIRHDRLCKGIGSILLKEMIGSAKAIGYHSILAAISADQQLSVKIHKRHGFKKAAHLKEVGYKFNKWLDVVYYQLLI